MGYGKTLELDGNGDLKLNEIKRINQIIMANKVKQDLTVLLKTQKGSDCFNPDFGLDMVKIVNYGYDKRMIDLELRRALSRYRYLKSIECIEIEDPDENRKVAVEIRLTTTEDETLAMGVIL